MARQPDEIRIAVWIPREEWMKFRSLAAEAGETSSEIIRRLMGIWVEKRENLPKKDEKSM